MDSLYIIDVPQKDYIPMIDDIARVVMIQISIQLLLFATDPEQNKFFTIDFVLLVTYIVLGVSLYWLVFKKLIRFS
jgi:heme/copper-type cytochrome/quinol oxidase subunit 4